MYAKYFPNGISKFKHWYWADDTEQGVAKYTVKLHDLDPNVHAKLPAFYDSQNHNNYGVMGRMSGRTAQNLSENLTHLDNGDIIPFPMMFLTSGSKSYYPNDSIV